MSVEYREYIGTELPPDYDQELLDRYHHYSSQVAKGLGYQAHINGIWLRIEDLHSLRSGDFPGRYLIEGVDSNRFFLEGYSIGAITTPEGHSQVCDAYFRLCEYMKGGLEDGGVLMEVLESFRNLNHERRLAIARMKLR